MPPLEHLREMKSLLRDINDVLSNYGIGKTINLSDVTITNKTVSDGAKQVSTLSDAITDHLWPSISSASVYHFTSKKAAESILNNNTFRLTNIAKRYNEGEIKTFCETHNLNGYLEMDSAGLPKYRNLIMPNTYYASFTDTNLTNEQEQYFWRTFATSDGVRLRIDILAKNPNFRKMRYEQKKGCPIGLLNDLVSCVRDNHNREFILNGISRLCSFYLSGKDYGIENEYRMLHRVWDGFGPQPVGIGENSYIELPLGTMTQCGYKLDITEVHSVTKPTMPASYVFSQRKV